MQVLGPSSCHSTGSIRWRAALRGGEAAAAAGTCASPAWGSPGSVGAVGSGHPACTGAQGGGFFPLSPRLHEAFVPLQPRPKERVLLLPPRPHPPHPAPFPQEKATGAVRMCPGRGDRASPHRVTTPPGPAAPRAPHPLPSPATTRRGDSAHQTKPRAPFRAPRHTTAEPPALPSRRQSS